jgi:pimeloyl-ACP methyl ester carboxylesterase
MGDEVALSRHRVAVLRSAVLIPFVLGACVSPARSWWRYAADAGFDSTVVAGDPFRHVILEGRGRASRALHVYLDGDGTPWNSGGPSVDPTPRNTLVLDLMRLDGSPRLFLGRPCYHGLVDDVGCAPALWTSERYSDRVVSSMAAALTRHLSARGVERLAFIGYSGGGSLAMLLASRFTQTVAVVTVAANLDIDAWASYHRYLPLAGSLNPASQPPLPRPVYRRHYVGARDSVVPPEIVARGSTHDDEVVVVPDFDHVCCWPRLWPSIIEGLARAIEPS